MPSSFAKRYAGLPKVRVDKPWFSVATERPVVPGRSRRAKTKFLFPEGDHPAAGADEVRVVQPYWSKKLKDFPEDLAVVLEDTHRSAAYGDRKPDVVGYLANKPRSVFHIALVGDVKARRQANKESFDASEMGHLESFLEELLLEFQPYRQSVNGFLTDGCLIQFFRLEKIEAQLLWTEGPVLYLHDGGDQWLLGLLQDTSAHGVPAVAIGQEPVAMGQLLGVGGSSVVYTGMFQGAQVVVKRFTSSLKLNHLEQEAANLDKIRHVVPRVPRLIAHDNQHLVLLLQPVGVQFVSRVAHFDQLPLKRAVATADDFCQLVDILETVHSQHNLCHRDVRLPNFFRDQETGVVFLNDWGCATEVGKSVRFSGALQHAPRRVLESLIRDSTYTPHFSDDLEMVVRSVFHSLSMTTFEQIRTREDATQISKFWEHHLAPPTWAKMLAAAQRGDYAELKTRIRKLLP